MSSIEVKPIFEETTKIYLINFSKAIFIVFYDVLFFIDIPSLFLVHYFWSYLLLEV